ncbi:PIN domain-containing protein [Brevibacterium yomogidense]|uniref:PIN domain-containing protein n=1 Tax=Brevibacterium yomogidense TaxID=946573 RepID=UPI0018E03B74|nr:PIN domain-containing protein [Brevibacterium yomogidense]
MITRVLPDANVLFSRTTRDWLLLLADAAAQGAFTVTYTEDILSETVYNLRRNYPHLTGTQITRINDSIAVAMSERIDDYGNGSDGPIADPFDNHVHAAAVAGRIDALVTSDKGFLDLTDEAKDSLPYEIYCPDEFFLLVDNSMPHHVRAVFETMLQHHQSVGKSLDFDDALVQSSCPRFAERVRAHWAAHIR